MRCSLRCGAALSLALVLVLLVLAPFAAALEIHHALAAADHDGHQHSESDLCQWVQHHTGQSLLTGLPLLHLWHAVAECEFAASDRVWSARLIAAGSPRAPPAR